MNIAVVAGGLSPERDVSLSSGSLIACALQEAGHKVVLFDLYEGLQIEGGEFKGLFKGCGEGDIHSYKVSDKAPDLAEINRIISSGLPQIGENVLNICRAADIVFIALHGASGENGQLQATFNMLGIRYTGTDYSGCLLAMDKDLTKKLLRDEGIPTAKWLTMKADGADMNKIEAEIGCPCVIKPCSAGSSIGVSIVETKEELLAGIAAAKEVEADILIEQKIVGREFSVGILLGEALPVIEIRPKQGFYDYRNKYQTGLTEEICPAELSEAERERVQSLALRVHKLLRLGSYSRVDFILDKDGQFICLEANTLPGMTPTSLLPQEAAVTGISYIELCDKIVRASTR